MMTTAEQLEQIRRIERREVDRRLAAQMEGGRRLVQRRRAEAELTAAFDEYFHHKTAADVAELASRPLPLLPTPLPVPELVIPGREGGRWVGSFSDSWGEGR